MRKEWVASIFWVSCGIFLGVYVLGPLWEYGQDAYYDLLRFKEKYRIETIKTEARVFMGKLRVTDNEKVIQAIRRESQKYDDADDQRIFRLHCSYCYGQACECLGEPYELFPEDAKRRFDPISIPGVKFGIPRNKYRKVLV